MSNGPSIHLAWTELACHDPQRTPYPVEWRDTRAVILGVEFDTVRAAVGVPIVILSGYRTPDWNRHVGGAPASQHVQGRALDLQPPDGWTVERLFDAIHPIALSSASHIGGIGRYPTFVHIDVRPLRADGKLTAWQGARAWAEGKA